MLQLHAAIVAIAFVVASSAGACVAAIVDIVALSHFIEIQLYHVWTLLVPKQNVIKKEMF